MLELPVREGLNRGSASPLWVFKEVVLWTCAISAFSLSILVLFLSMKWSSDVSSLALANKAQIQDLRREIDVVDKLIVLNKPNGCSVNKGS